MLVPAWSVLANEDGLEVHVQRLHMKDRGKLVQVKLAVPRLSDKPVVPDLNVIVRLDG